MKTLSPGLSDSIASVLADPPPCPHCDSSSHIAGGLCVGCLLEAGLDPEDEGGSDSLTGILAEVNLPDQNWRLGNYEILEEIGRGGMGVIYRARQRHSRRIVAVKRVLSYHSDSRETLARFRREAQAAASLDHPNILPIYEVSQGEDGLPFFSMKFASGGTLQQVAPALRTEPRQCVALVAKIARAVQYAHSRGIVHRDLKPGNILLDGRGEPLVSDFGLAKWLDTSSDLTRTLTIFGTPGYIAPEQASQSAAELKPTADIYSLGAILFDLLAGRPPFLGTHALSVIRQASELPAPKLRTLSKLADRDLETICSRSLDRDPKLRYPSAHDLAEDLERWLEGRPIIARPVAVPLRAYRWARRNPKFAASVAGAAVLGGLGLVAAASSNRLASIVREAENERRSVVVAPFEDLDLLSTDSEAALSASEAFQNVLRGTSGVSLRQIADRHREVVPPLTPAVWKQVGSAAGARMILSGTVRQREGHRHMAIHLIETASGTIVKVWFEEGSSFSGRAGVSVPRILEAMSNQTQSSTLGAAPNPKLDYNSETTGPDVSTARSYCDRGKELMFRYNLADLDRAIDSFRTAIQIDPQYAEAQAMLASACQARAQTASTASDLLREAESAMTAALQLAPMLPEAYRAKGGILRRRGQLFAAVDPFLTAYELEPTDERALALLGDIYEQTGRPDLALGWFAKALRLQIRPFFADNIGNAWTGLGDYERAEKAYNTATIFRPDLPVGLLGLSRLALFRGDFEAAREKCRQARASYPSNPEPPTMGALIEFFGRDFERAEELYLALAKADSTGGIDFAGSVRYLSALGFIRNSHQAGTGRALLEEARALDEKQLSLTPDNSRRLYSLAANHSALGKSLEASRALEKAVAAGWIDYRSLMMDPRFDSIRGTPAFQTLVDNILTKVQKMKKLQPVRQLAANLK